jgi:lysophospholipase L1-like esterase
VALALLAGGCGTAATVAMESSDGGGSADGGAGAGDGSIAGDATAAEAGASTDASGAGDGGDAGRSSGTDAGEGGAVVDAGPGSGKVYLAFIGDSITAGTGASTFASDWVSLVGSRLGPSAVVGNFGVSGTTMMKVSDAPYWDTDGLSRTTAFLQSAGASDVAAVVIMLGTNDAKDDPSGVDNWNGTAPQRYPADYVSMIQLVQAARTPAPRVFLALPPKAFTYDYGIDPTVVAQQVVPIVRALAADGGLPLIDVFAATADAGGDFPDGIHPDDDGQMLVAAAVYAAITPVVAPDGGWPDGG